MKNLIGVVFIAVTALISACSDGSVTDFDREYSELIADGIRETIDTESDGMFSNFVRRTEAATGMDLDEFTTECTARIMTYAGGDIPDHIKDLVIEYKDESGSIGDAPQTDGMMAVQVSDLIEGKIYHCLRSASLSCCGQQS